MPVYFFDSPIAVSTDHFFSQLIAKYDKTTFMLTVKMNLKIKKYMLWSCLFLFAGCNPRMNPITLGEHLKNQQQTDNVNDVPTTLEQPADDSQTIDAQNIDDTPTVVETKATEPTKANDGQSVEKPNPNSKPASEKKEASKFIQTAFDVMKKEGVSLGTPCNFYLMRVLMRAGFKNEGFRANDFDVYAKKNFKFYKAEDFKIDSTKSDADELKKYLWSFDERTPFILQWTRPGNFGHVAILERIGENLIIYQASIGNHTARRDLTTIEKLLSSKHRASLTVYSEFR